jgi:hypothetical protein
MRQNCTIARNRQRFAESRHGQRDATLQFQHDAPNAPTPFRVRLRGQAQ